MTTVAPREIGNYVLGDTLGEGGFARVKLGTNKLTGEKVALKVLAKKNLDTSSTEFKQVKREIDALTILQHPNILRMYEADWNARYPKADGEFQDVLLIVLELAGGGELFDFLSYTGAFDERIARTYFQQLVNGLKECHSQGIAHRDLKPENLLLNSEFVLKLADFGFAHFQGSNVSHVMKTECGTKGYMAPEVLSGKSYDESADLFAAGVILFIMLAGFPPFQIANKTDWWFNKLMSDKHSLFWKAHERTAYFSDAAKDLINKILSPDPSKRITIEQIEGHDWFKGPVLSAEELREDLSTRKVQVDANKSREKANKKAGGTKLIELGDSYIVNRAILGADGLPLQDPLLMASKKGAAGTSEEGKDYDLRQPDVYTEDAGMGAYTVFDTQLESLSMFAVMYQLLEAIQCTHNFDLSQKCTIKARFMPKNPVLQVPKDLLEEDGYDALSIEGLNRKMAQEADNAIEFSIKVYQSASDKNKRVVVVRRTQGSALTFQQFFDEMIETLEEWGYVKN